MGWFDRLKLELSTIVRLVRTLRRMRSVKPGSDTTLVEVWEGVIDRHRDRLAIISDEASYTYRDYEEHANRYANWALAQGWKRGDVVALLMENRPEYLFAWLGLAKAGLTSALINTNLMGQPLAHSLTVANAKAIIVGAELADNLAAVIPQIGGGIPVYQTGAGGVLRPVWNDLDAALAAQSTARPDKAKRAGLTNDDKLFYIYTSGTTGLPKAANISHYRALRMVHAFAVTADATPQDRMYCVLPLYHSAGGICAMGTVLSVGGALIVRRKFSASAFWSDAVRHQATLFQYIGELCRYLLNAPSVPEERQHRIRRAIGNGLRPDIWEPFQRRFGIKSIAEFYGATEGNIAMVNVNGQVGAVGRIPGYLDKIFNVKLVRFDVEAQKPVRGADGFCIACAPGEVGEALGKIETDPSKPLGRFEGYTSQEESDRKILRDVFEKGDAWFRSGDLLRRDEDNNFFFVDRIGDTFRWKGENVATSEVSEVISTYPGVQEANVYGVHVPGRDGRAGMVALVAEPGIDLAGLRQHIERNLPAYARPLFVRLLPQMDSTGTFKQRKVELVQDGFDPARISDPLLFLPPDAQEFEALNAPLYGRIVDGSIRL
ncbi:long-chain-acyl-CoA synthetase [Zavarzinia sp. CC-PAN008]|uniref:long-chain-acyl-CoA synthetase n=1 Tax=Zavarzinia sp. CC-PAN008 TaxID=3243332 RepID=UPI003F742226